MNRRLIFVTGALALLGWITSLATTEMNIALTAIAHSMHLQPNNAGWLITAYLIAFGSSTLLGGRYGDMYGYKKILFIGIALFALGSLVGYFAADFGQLVIARVAQGIGASLVWPSCIAVANRMGPEKHKGLLMGIMTAAVGLGQVFGPLVSAWLVNEGWRLIFLFNIPFLALVTLVLYSDMPSFKLEAKHSISYGYFVSFVVLVASLVTWLHSYNILTFSKLLYIALGVLIVAGFGLFLKLQSKSPRALLATELFRVKQYPLSLFTRFCGVFSFYGYLYFAVIYFSKHFGLSAEHISYTLLSMTIVMAMTSIISGTLIDKFGVSLSNYIGYSSLVVGYGINFLFANSIWGIISGGVFIGAGMGFSNAGAIRLGLEHMPEALSATASSTFFMVSLISGAISVSMLEMFVKALPGAVTTIFNIQMIVSAVIALLWIIVYTIYQVGNDKRTYSRKKMQYAMR